MMIHDYFDDSNFSNVPILFLQSYSNSSCIVFNGEKMSEKYEINPRLYENRKNPNECVIFTDDGWKSISKNEIESDCSNLFHEEIEWNIKNPVKFEIEDIDFITIPKNLIKDEKDLYMNHQSSVLSLAIKNKMTLEEVNNFVKKFHVVDYDKNTDSYIYQFPLFKNEIENVIQCNMFSNTIYNKKEYFFKGCVMISKDGFTENL